MSKLRFGLNLLFMLLVSVWVSQHSLAQDIFNLNDNQFTLTQVVELPQGDGVASCGIRSAAFEQPAQGPRSFAVDANHQIYIADTENARILILQNPMDTTPRIIETFDIYASDIATDGDILYVLSTTGHVSVHTVSGQFLTQLTLDSGVNYHKIDWNRGRNPVLIGKRYTTATDSFDTVKTLILNENSSFRTQNVPVSEHSLHSPNIRFTTGQIAVTENNITTTFIFPTSDQIAGVSWFERDANGYAYIRAFSNGTPGDLNSINTYLYSFSADGVLSTRQQIPEYHYAQPNYDLRVAADGTVYQLLNGDEASYILRWNLLDTNGVQAQSANNLPDARQFFWQQGDFVQPMAPANDDLQPAIASSTQTNNTGTLISRSEVIANALAYANHPWTPTSQNVSPVAVCADRTVSTDYVPRVNQQQTGLPYRWGGYMSIASFDSRLANGAYPGDRGTSTICNAGNSNRDVVGVDCSGFVSQVLEVPTHLCLDPAPGGYCTTSELPSVGQELSDYRNLRPGDYLNKPGHVALFHSFNDDGSINVIESTVGVSPARVVQRPWYSYSAYKAYRYIFIQDSDLCEPGFNEVALFERTNFDTGGFCQVFDASQTSFATLNDNVRSIRVGRDVEAILYENSDFNSVFSGASQLFTISDADITNLGWGASSLTILPLSTDARDHYFDWVSQVPGESGIDIVQGQTGNVSVQMQATSYNSEAIYVALFADDATTRSFRANDWINSEQATNAILVQPNGTVNFNVTLQAPADIDPNNYRVFFHVRTLNPNNGLWEKARENDFNVIPQVRRTPYVNYPVTVIDVNDDPTPVSESNITMSWASQTPIAQVIATRNGRVQVQVQFDDLTVGSDPDPGLLAIFADDAHTLESRDSLSWINDTSQPLRVTNANDIQVNGTRYTATFYLAGNNQIEAIHRINFHLRYFDVTQGTWLRVKAPQSGAPPEVWFPFNIQNSTRTLFGMAWDGQTGENQDLLPLGTRIPITVDFRYLGPDANTLTASDLALFANDDETLAYHDDLWANDGSQPYRVTDVTHIEAPNANHPDTYRISLNLKINNGLSPDVQPNFELRWFNGSSWIPVTTYHDQPPAAVWWPVIPGDAEQTTLYMAWRSQSPAGEGVDIPVGNRVPVSVAFDYLSASDAPAPAADEIAIFGINNGSMAFEDTSWANNTLEPMQITDSRHVTIDNNRYTFDFYMNANSLAPGDYRADYYLAYRDATSDTWTAVTQLDGDTPPLVWYPLRVFGDPAGNPPTDAAAEVINLTQTITMQPNETRTITVAIRNRGVDWGIHETVLAEADKPGRSNAFDAFDFALFDPSFPTQVARNNAAVAEGEVYNFTFNITAPDLPTGTYVIDLGVARPAYMPDWVDDWSGTNDDLARFALFVNLENSTQPDRAAVEVPNETIRITMSPGATRAIEIPMINRGVAWDINEAVLARFDRDFPNDFPTFDFTLYDSNFPTRVSRNAMAVSTGATYRFPIVLTAPQSPTKSLYTISLAPARPAYAPDWIYDWTSTQDEYATVTVIVEIEETPPTTEALAEVLTLNRTINVQPGATGQVAVSFINRGVPWSTNQVVLANALPQGQTDDFFSFTYTLADSGPFNSWVAKNTSYVSTGSEGTFEFGVIVPDNLAEGTYTVYLALARPGFTPDWIFDYNNQSEFARLNLTVVVEDGPSFGSCTNINQIPQSECNGLLNLYNVTNGDNWLDNSGWLQSPMPCDDWYGIHCNNDKTHVDVISLSQNNLVGIFPDVSMFSSLVDLRLGDNSLTGSIPLTVGQLSFLETFSVHDNMLTGSIPSTVNNLTSLTRFDVSDNELSGDLPVLPSLIRLEDFLVGRNKLTGFLGPSLSNSPLQRLELDYNQFEGPFLPALCSSPDLYDLELKYNRLEITDPTSIACVQNLEPIALTTQTVPVELTQANVLSDGADLRWLPVVFTSEDGWYEITVRQGSQTGTVILSTNTVDKFTDNYFVTGLTPSTTYCYSIVTFTEEHGRQQSDLRSSPAQDCFTTGSGASANGTFYFAPDDGANYPGLIDRDGYDIIRYVYAYGNSGVIESYTLNFDGAANGLAAADIDGYARLDDGSFIFSTVSGETLPNVGSVDDADIIRYNGSTYSFYVRASQVNPADDLLGEDIDALGYLNSSCVVFSTGTGFDITPNDQMDDQDLACLNPSTKAITFLMDGSDFGLPDIQGVHPVSDSEFYIITSAGCGVLGNPDFCVTQNDILHVMTAGPSWNTIGTVELIYRGSETGMGLEHIDALEVVGTLPDLPPPSPPEASFTPSATTVNLGDNITFTSTSTGRSPLSHSWDFGDGVMSTLQNPTHTFTAPNTYDVRLIINNEGGTDTAIVSVTVLPPVPIADFTADSLAVDPNVPIQFTDVSTGFPTEWLWDFGAASDDSDISTEQNPVFDYAEPGMYTVTLTVTNITGTDSKTVVDYITINEMPPIADFTVDATEVIVNTPIQFQDLSGNNTVNYLWEFGDGRISRETNPTHIYTQTGIYTVMLTVENVAGTDSEQKLDYVTVLPPPPIARFDVSAIEVNVNETVVFIDRSQGIPESWTWDFGDGTFASGPGPHVHVYTSEGQYTPSLTVSSQSGSDTQVQDVPPINVIIDTQASTITGTVQDTSGGAMEHVSVWMYEAGTSLEMATTCTDAAGEYSFMTDYVGDVDIKAGNQTAQGCTYATTAYDEDIATVDVVAGSAITVNLILTPDNPPFLTPILTSPSGIQSAQTPTFQWNAIAGVSAYQISINGAETRLFTISEDAACSGSSACSYTPDVGDALPFALTTYNAIIRAANSLGESLWGGTTYFAVSPSINTPSGGSTILAPTESSISSRTPTLEWTPPISGASHYDIYALYQTYSEYITVSAVDANCNPNCSYVLNAQEGYTGFRILPKNYNGYSGWSSARYFFTTAATAVATPPTLANPTGTVNTSTTTITWNFEPGVNRYSIYTIQPSIYGSTFTFIDAQALCPSYPDATTCSFDLNTPWSGTYTVQINARNPFGWSGYGISPLVVDLAPPDTILSAPTWLSDSLVRTDRSFPLAWSEVEGAISYTLVMYNPLGVSDAQVYNSSVCSDGICTVIYEVDTNGLYTAYVRATGISSESAFALSSFPVRILDAPSIGRPIVDADGDGIDDSFDNCTTIANAEQLDRDGDGIGAACDWNDSPNSLPSVGSDEDTNPNDGGRDLPGAPSNP